MGRFPEIMENISENRYLKAISKAMIMSVAPTMVGAICTLLLNIQNTSYQDFLQRTNLVNFLNLPIQFTTNIMALFVVYFVTKNIVSVFKVDNSVAGILGIVSFFILTPLTNLEAQVNGATRMVSYFSFDWVGAKGMFVAILVGIIIGRFYVWLIDHKVYIKMPSTVPSFVEKSFAILVPFILITLFTSAVSYIFSLTSFGNIHEMIYGYLQVPLQSIGGSVGGVMVAYVVINLCWWFGIHGKALVFSVVAPIWSSLTIENAAATNAGTIPPNTIDLGFTTIFMEIGGAGCIIGLAILFTFFAKSKRYKGVGKITIVPSIFGINEPITFGTPVVLNPLFFIPVIVTPLLCGLLGYAAIVTGFVPRMTGVQLPTAVPLVINAFLLGKWQGIIVQVVAILLSVGVYYPFFKKADSVALAEELENEKLEEKEADSALDEIGAEDSSEALLGVEH